MPVDSRGKFDQTPGVCGVERLRGESSDHGKVKIARALLFETKIQHSILIAGVANPR